MTYVQGFTDACATYGLKQSELTKIMPSAPPALIRDNAGSQPVSSEAAKNLAEREGDRRTDLRGAAGGYVLEGAKIADHVQDRRAERTPFLSKKQIEDLRAAALKLEVEPGPYHTPLKNHAGNLVGHGAFRVIDGKLVMTTILGKDMTPKGTSLSHVLAVKTAAAGHNPATSLQYWKDYLNHSALNAGQAARDVRYMTNHPHADAVAPGGSARHMVESLKHRIPSLANNLKYTVLPPQWHHTPESLVGMSDSTPRQWFLSGYAPWKHKIPNDPYVAPLDPRGEKLGFWKIADALSRAIRSGRLTPSPHNEQRLLSQVHDVKPQRPLLENAGGVGLLQYPGRDTPRRRLAGERATENQISWFRDSLRQNSPLPAAHQERLQRIQELSVVPRMRELGNVTRDEGAPVFQSTLSSPMRQVTPSIERAMAYPPGAQHGWYGGRTVRTDQLSNRHIQPGGRIFVNGGEPGTRQRPSLEHEVGEQWLHNQAVLHGKPITPYASHLGPEATIREWGAAAQNPVSWQQSQKIRTFADRNINLQDLAFPAAYARAGGTQGVPIASDSRRGRAVARMYDRAAAAIPSHTDYSPDDRQWMGDIHEHGLRGYPLTPGMESMLQHPRTLREHEPRLPPEKLGFWKLADVDTDLQPHQQRVVDRLLREDQPGLVAMHGMGSGKTLTSIAAADALGLPADVILPAALRANYVKELHKHAPKDAPETHIQSLENVARRQTALRNPLLIVDEAHRSRNPSMTQKALQNSEAKKRLLLTGSLFYNQPSDAAGPINLVAGSSVLPSDPDEFKRLFVRETENKPNVISALMGQQPGMHYDVNPEHKAYLQSVLNRYVDYHPSSTKDFPTREDQTIGVPMTTRQKEIYDTILGKAPKWVHERVVSGLPPRKSEVAQLNQFLQGTRQVSNSTAPYHLDRPPDQPKIDRAVNELQKLLDKNPQAKALVYSNYLDAGINPYKQQLDERKIPYGEFTGMQSRKKRDQMVQDYNDNKLRALLLSRAGGEGLDLKGTRLIQLLEPHWNEEALKQVTARGIRYKSHADLPEDQRNVMVQHYVTQNPRQSVLQHLRLKDPERSVDQYLLGMAEQKERLNQKFRDLLTEENV